MSVARHFVSSRSTDRPSWPEASRGDIYFYNGEACLKGKIGIGKLSKKFERCIGTEYNSGDGWMIDY